MENKKRHFYWIIYLLSSLLIYPIITSFITNINIDIILDFLLISIFIIYQKSYFKTQLLYFINFFKEKYKYILNKAFAILFLNVFSSIIVSFIIEFILNESSNVVNQDILDSMIYTSPLMMFITVGIFAPIIEELVFRLSLFGIFKNRNMKKTAYFFGAVIFSILHTILNLFTNGLFASLLMNVPYILISLILCKEYEKTDLIFYVIFLHSFNNIIAFIMTFI